MLPRVARAEPHFFEEPMLSGTRGSGAVFFSGCSLRCVFCQNKEISAHQKGELCNEDKLAAIFLKLQNQGVHNINLVTPTPHIEGLISALLIAKAKGLNIPVVYNSSGYESVGALKRLNGLIDIYLPDFKYVTPAISEAYSGVSDYFAYAAPAIEEMLSQTGRLRLDSSGIAQSGVIIRHLVLPGNLDETRTVLQYIRNNYPKETYVSLMSQYTPISEYRKDSVNPFLSPPLDRALTKREYGRVVDYCMSLGFENVLVQERGASDKRFIPEFYNKL